MVSHHLVLDAPRYQGVGADFEKPKNIFSAHNKQGSIKRGEKWFPEKLRKFFINVFINKLFYRVNCNLSRFHIS